MHTSGRKKASNEYCYSWNAVSSNLPVHSRTINYFNGMLLLLAMQDSMLLLFSQSGTLLSIVYISFYHSFLFFSSMSLKKLGNSIAVVLEEFNFDGV
ncbi:hypothetical protein CAEBREN_28841 [Caenorhabditis brenneri]|uniref:Uncharacterized protein n=1 Tax=Caenorhabditis brenneri TaxID=135651 RepID=G0PJ37_CAEBE|nr:hypothetical protein CAEBREN_28841 [Caenorhabditis brenneri]